MKREDWIALRNANLLKWFNGNTSAVELLLILSRISETWDDLVDQDREVTESELERCFWAALVELPCNQFFAENKTALMPLIVASINSWLDSNKLARGDKTDRTHAFTLTRMDIQIAQHIALLTGGYDHMRDVSVPMWKFFTSHDDADTWIDGE